MDKIRVPPIDEQHPLQIRQRPVQKAQSQKSTATFGVEEHELNCTILQQAAAQKPTTASLATQAYYVKYLLYFKIYYKFVSIFEEKFVYLQAKYIQ